ncbi:MAG: hypothetical protein AB1716_19590 [Planctomycetota bacterium]
MSLGTGVYVCARFFQLRGRFVHHHHLIVPSLAIALAALLLNLFSCSSFYRVGGQPGLHFSCAGWRYP